MTALPRLMDETNQLFQRVLCSQLSLAGIMARYASGAWVVMHDSVTVVLQTLSHQSSGVFSAWWPVSIPGHSSLVSDHLRLTLPALSLKALSLRLASTERSACHHLTAATRVWARRGQVYRQSGPAWPGDISSFPSGRATTQIWEILMRTHRNKCAKCGLWDVRIFNRQNTRKFGSD